MLCIVFSGKRHAGKLACVVWEGGNGKGSQGTSPVPYFILRGGNGGNAIFLTRPWKKRFRYGTLLVDLERRKIIEVLPDRESATIEKWLKKHPDVKVVSRDRGKDFRKAATLAAPQAQQVVDRFHLQREAKILSQVLE